MSSKNAYCLTIERSPESLAEVLARRGFPLDLRCGGKGICGACLVELLEGVWESNGHELKLPTAAKACQVSLRSPSGKIAIPENSLPPGNGKISLDWTFGGVPECDDAVIAVDLGTTTFAAIKIQQGRIFGRASCFNGQNQFGDNVITRICHAGLKAENLLQLQQAAANSINELLLELGTEGVSRIAVAGNTFMSTVLHGIDPNPLGSFPFTAPLRVFPVRKATELGLNAEVPLYTVPAISAYIGGDLIAGLAEIDLKPGEMLVDIGTNCEIIFHAQQGLVCAAAAAGPAFEGAGIHCGMRAVNGAIEHYFGQGKYSVIGNCQARGLCGSAMLDFLAVERQLGRLNEFGRLLPQNETFDLAPGVFLHEWDISQLLKAKAAVAAGIQTLEEHCHCNAGKIHLAGAFAQHLNLSNAISIGMLPSERKYRVLGNSSLAGAAHLACRPEFAATLQNCIAGPCEIPLNSIPSFEDNFIDALLLP
jgi:uncharacterized 2Fe-2S/4Fe-4S cluster protein (DUF4445 family)